MASAISEYNIPSDEDDDGDDDNLDEDSSGSSDDESESGDDDDEEEEESEDECPEIESKSGMNAEFAAHSSEDDPERDCCPICLNKFIGQDLGTPESCEHTFCFDCIEEWSKNINTCPIDRTEFNTIQLRATPGGNVLRKVKVKVRPKEPEEAFQESVTLCEVCRCGDREDRLLLCDGCDLAFHCECLDPPLFYIPIEEWFCPPCSGVFQNRAVAGPSGSRRRAIPRTRASETVRSRVQNLRTGGSTSVASRSTSRPKKATSTARPRKKRRRTYRRTFKKVVQLARTMKDMSHGNKSKVGARGSTVIVTYRRRRRKKRRSTKGKLSRRSVASTKALSVPSAQQRIAKSLGISKPLEGSTIPQVKQPTGSRAGSRVSKMPSHSLFGNHNQLMDFDEDFNDDVNRPSTSKAASPPKRPSNNAASGLSLLDSIMAGQKILHCKSENVVIKTDGSLILKESNSSFKKTDNTKKVDTEHSARTPMSVALVKTGVKNLILTSDKNSSVRQKSTNSSKSKHGEGSNISKSSSKEKTSSKTNSSGDRWFSKSNCLNSKASASSSFVKKNNDKEISGKTSLFNKAAKNQSETSNKGKDTASNVENVDSLMDGFDYDTPSDWESEIMDTSQSNITNRSLKNSLNSHLVQENNSSNSTSSNSRLRKLLQKTSSSDVTKSTSVVQIKKEVLSDDETDADATSTSENAINVKKEVLSDEETNVDTWLEKSRQESTCNKLTHPIKSEPIDSDSEPDVLKNHSLDLQRILSDCSKKNCSNESDVSDCEASQSIIDIVPKSFAQSSVSKCSNTEKHWPVKVKEEPQSDSDDYSQSLVSTADINSVSQSVSSSITNSTFNSSFSQKSKKVIDGRKVLLSSELKLRNGNLNSDNHSDLFIENKLKKGASDTSILKKKLSSTSSETLSAKAVYHSSADARNIDHSSVGVNNTSDDDDFPCTQASSPAIRDSSSEDEAGSDRTCENDKDIPSTQAIFPEDIPSEDDDDIPCAQMSPVVNNNLSDEEDLPCAQMSPVVNNNLSDEEDLPCTQVMSPVVHNNPSDDEDMPHTQAVPPVASDNPCDEEDLPCTQVTPFSAEMPSLNEDEDLPATQVMSFSVPKNKTFSAISNPNNNYRAMNIDISSSAQFTPPRNDQSIKSSFKIPSVPVCKVPKKTSLGSSIEHDQCSFDELPPTQANFEFLKPVALSKKDVSSIKKPDKTISTPFSSNANSNANDEAAKKHFKYPSNIKSKSGSILTNAESEHDTHDLPATQVFPLENVALSDALINDESFDLPATQISSVPVNNPLIANNRSSALAESPQISSCAAKTRNLHDREKESLDLPETQVVKPSLEKINEPRDSNSMDEYFSLPATQVFNPSSGVESVNQKQFDDVSDDIFSLPATQVSIPKDSEIYKSNKNSSELLSIQNQRSGEIREDAMKNKFDKNCNGNKLSASTNEHSNSAEDTTKLSDSQLLDLPATQLSHENSSLSAGPSELNKSVNSHKALESETRNEKEEGNKLKDIISNIKLLVNSLSAKDPKMPIFDSDENTNNENPPLDNHDVSESTEDMSDTINDCSNADIENLKNLETDLDNLQQLSHAELKEIASKSNNEVPDKSVGVHRHLPQVIAKLPVKEPVKIKPSYKKTFSFEEVAKMKGIGQSECAEEDSVDDELPPTQRMDFESLNTNLDATKNLPNKSNLKSTISSFNREYLDMSNDKVAKNFHNKFKHQFFNFNSEENGFPVTQKGLSSETASDDSSDTQLFKNALRCNVSSLKVSKTHTYVTDSKDRSKPLEHCSSTKEQSNKILSVNSNEDDLPATQALFDNENLLGISSNIEEHGSHSSKNKNSKEKRNANIITIRNKNKSSDNSNEDDLPPTQAIFNNENHLGTSSNIEEHRPFSGKNKNSKEKRNANIITIRNKNKSSDNSIEDDLPPTQALFNNEKHLGISSNIEEHGPFSSKNKNSKEKRNANIITIRNKNKTSDNSNEDDLPPTQALFNNENHLGISSNIEEHGSHSSKNKSSKEKRNANIITIRNKNKTSDNSNEDDLPPTQALFNNENHLGISSNIEEHGSHSSKNKSSKEKKKANIITIRNKNKTSDDSNVDDLPATQALFHRENGSSSNEISKDKRSSNIITIRNSTTSKLKSQKESKGHLESHDINDQYAVKSSKLLEEKSSSNSKHSKDRNAKSKYFHSDKSEVNAANELSKIKARQNPVIGNRVMNIAAHNESLESSLDSELDDLPPTQVWNNFSENSSDTDLTRRHGQNNETALHNHTKDISTASKSKFKKPSDGKSSKDSSCKRKNSYEDESHRSKKKEIDQMNVSQSMKLPDAKVDQLRDRSRTLKRPSGNQMNDKENESLRSKKLKLTSNKAQNDSRHGKDSSSLPSTYQQDESNKMINNAKNYADHVTTSNQANFPEGIKIKQEKMDSGFAVPSVDISTRNLAASSNINSVRIKTENMLDSLPETQVFNHNRKENTCHSTITDGCVPLLSSVKTEVCSDDEISVIEKEKNNLSTSSVQLASSIKREVCSDDEISVIEMEKNAFTASGVQLPANIKREVCSDDEVSIIEIEENLKRKVEEEIIIEDDEVENETPLVAEMNYATNCEEEVPVQTASIASIIKKEKCLERNEVFHKSASQRSDVLSKQSEKNGSENVSFKDKMPNKDIATSKNNEKRPRMADKDKNLKDSLVSKNKKLEKNKTYDSEAKSKRPNHEHKTKNAENSKNSNKDHSQINTNKKNLVTDSLKGKKLPPDSLKPQSSNPGLKSSSKPTSKHPSEGAQNKPEKLKQSSEKLKVKSSEKENTSAVKNKEIFITLKPHQKRSLENDDARNGAKRGKYSLDSDSCSSDSSIHQRIDNSSSNCINSNTKSKSRGFVDDKLSSSTPRSDVSVDSVKASKHRGIKHSSSNPFNEEVVKIFTKQDLKEEIANEVKIVLKPFFSTGLISKDDYKDIMRRAVPKIFMNCHNCINPEKISKLVLSYVALLSKS